MLCISVCGWIWRSYLWLHLPAAFTGLWSWVWEMRDDLWSDSSLFPLLPPFYSCSNAPHKMQLVCELIPPPAELQINLLSLLSLTLPRSVFLRTLLLSVQLFLKEHVFLLLLLMSCLTSCQQTWRIKFHTSQRWISLRSTEVMTWSRSQIINATVWELHI